MPNHLNRFFYATAEEAKTMNDLVQEIQNHAKRRRKTDMISQDLKDSFAECPAFDDHASIPKMLEILEKIAVKQDEHGKKLEEVKEVLEVFNNTKGFLRTLSVVGVGIKWVVGVSVAWGVAWAYIKHSVTVR